MNKKHQTNQLAKPLSASTFRSRRKASGMSLLEILIAVSILSGSVLALIIAFRRSGSDQENFSSERFTAMFLAQKVIEDIQDRVEVNPYYMASLIASASSGALSVRYGESPFFVNLNNTETGDPIVEGSGNIFHQLESFTCKIESRFVNDPQDNLRPLEHLIEISVTIGWLDSMGVPRNYRVDHMVYGFNREILKRIEDYSGEEPYSDQVAIKALFNWLAPNSRPPQLTWNAFRAFNRGGDERVLKPLGAILAGTLMAEASARDFETAIDVARQELSAPGTNANPAKIAKWKEHLARLRKHGASSLLAIFSRLERDIRDLSAMNLNRTSLGERAFRSRRRFAQSSTVLMGYLLRVSLGFAQAETVYRELLHPPHPGVPLNRRISMIHQWLDLRKLGLLMAAEWNDNLPRRLRDHRRVVNSLIRRYRGRKPAFVEYLQIERNIAGTASTLRSELAALHRQIANSLGISRELGRIRTKLNSAS